MSRRPASPPQQQLETIADVVRRYPDNPEQALAEIDEWLYRDAPYGRIGFLLALDESPYKNEILQRLEKYRRPHTRTLARED